MKTLQISRIGSTRFALLKSTESEKIGLSGDIVLHIYKSEVTPFSRPISPAVCDESDFSVHSSHDLSTLDRELIDAIGVILSDINDFEPSGDLYEVSQDMYVNLEKMTSHFSNGQTAYGWS
ncbi:hypothetical protein ACNAUY_08020 [Acinetobacter tibetensis]|uniref:hypothetical protein n=1 Tax=Acinetobacter tibetensis TaxID=2943497 RepID=UPI003A4D8FFB